MIEYRFLHSTSWQVCHGITGLVRTRDFTEWVRGHHQLQRVVLANSDDAGEFTRPHSRVVFRSVPLHWTAPPPPAPAPLPAAAPAEDPLVIAREFGPDPYAPAPPLSWRFKPMQ